MFGPVIVQGLLRLIDFAILVAGVSLADALCRRLGSVGPVQDQTSLGVLAFGGVLVVFGRARAVRQSFRDTLRARLGVVVLAMGWGSLAATLWSVAVAGLPLQAGWLAAWLATATVGAACGVLASATLVHALGRWQQLVPRVAVIGANGFGRGFSRRLQAQADRTTFLGLYDDEPGPGGAEEDVPVAGGFQELLARARRERVDAVVLAMPLADMGRITHARATLASMTADIYLATEATELICRGGRIDRLGGSPVVKIASRPLGEWQLVQKAAFDWVLGSLMLVALSPVLLLVCAAVRLDSPGPALFRQRRRGYNNTTFEVLKFRTMYTHLSDANADRQTTQDDPRVTRLGRFLRRTSLDELPQLINVLRGEMSLVGPRPHAVNTKAGNQLFADAVADYTLRYRIKPGITGWAQVNGWRGETRTREQIEGRVAHDLHYIDNWSLLLDLRILVLTVLRELNSKVAF